MKTGEELEHDARELDRALAKMSPREKEIFGNELAALFKAAIPQWPRPIPVTERLPNIEFCLETDPQSDAVLAYWVGGGWNVSIYSPDDGWWCNNKDELPTDSPTHWLPLPPTPE